MGKEPPILFGIETEYGIARDGVEDLDVVAESIALVRSAMEPGVRMRWDYEAENPHHDDCGWDVPELLTGRECATAQQRYLIVRRSSSSAWSEVRYLKVSRS